MAEDAAPDIPAPSARKAVDAVPLLVKVLEVVLAVFAIGLIVDPYNSFQRIYNKPEIKLNEIGVVYVTIAGYILIDMILIIGHLIGDRMPKRTSLLFSAMGALLFVVAGSVLVHDWRKLRGSYVHVQNNAIYASKQYMDMLISAAVFTFVDAAVFVLDIFVTYQQPSQFNIVVAILLTLLFGRFFFVAPIAIISRFTGDPIADTPMFLFGVVATPSFLTAAGGILSHG